MKDLFAFVLGIGVVIAVTLFVNSKRKEILFRQEVKKAVEVVMLSLIVMVVVSVMYSMAYINSLANILPEAIMVIIYPLCIIFVSIFHKKCIENGELINEECIGCVYFSFIISAFCMWIMTRLVINIENRYNGLVFLLGPFIGEIVSISAVFDGKPEGKEKKGISKSITECWNYFYAFIKMKVYCLISLLSIVILAIVARLTYSNNYMIFFGCGLFVAFFLVEIPFFMIKEKYRKNSS